MAPFRAFRGDVSRGVQVGGAQKGEGTQKGKGGKEKENERQEERKAEEKEEKEERNNGTTVWEEDDLYWQVTMKERISNHFIGSLTAQEQRWGPHFRPPPPPPLPPRPPR